MILSFHPHIPKQKASSLDSCRVCTVVIVLILLEGKRIADDGMAQHESSCKPRYAVKHKTQSHLGVTQPKRAISCFNMSDSQPLSGARSSLFSSIVFRRPITFQLMLFRPHVLSLADISV